MITWNEYLPLENNILNKKLIDLLNKVIGDDRSGSDARRSYSFMTIGVVCFAMLILSIFGIGEYFFYNV